MKPNTTLVLDGVVLASLHVAACLVARWAGFDHVSDDDFARVTIAQAFAHAPQLDPSGTSWLPFPFWSLGAGMMVVGRSLAAANGLALALHGIACSFPFLALRAVGVPRPRALAGIALGYLTPSALWLGAATVPESFTASFVAAATILLGMAPSARPARAAAGALLVLAATLSRYETWPVAAVLAIALVARRPRRPLLAIACALGPVLWMAWNAHAHDGPLHFFRRVSSFKRAIGQGATSPLEALLLYPRLLFTGRPEVTVPALLLLLRRPRRWLVPLLAVVAQVAFLAYGNLRDGAPAHHPERTLFACFVLLALFVADEGLAMVDTWRRRFGAFVIGCVGLLWSATTLRDAVEVPGSAPYEDRSPQRERGRALRELAPAHVTITPCAYEHFALVAELGAPERVTTLPRTNAEVTATCPRVELDAPP